MYSLTLLLITLVLMAAAEQNLFFLPCKRVNDEAPSLIKRSIRKLLTGNSPFPLFIVLAYLINARNSIDLIISETASAGKVNPEQLFFARNSWAAVVIYWIPSH